MDWQYSEPELKGENRFEIRVIKGEERTCKVWHPENIMTFSKCGKLIWSYWIKDSERWMGYSKGETPSAWLIIQPPNVEEKS